MAGEIVKTEGIVLQISPWSRTSHVVTWLTPDYGPVTTLVKGAVRPKSAFLGQYDLFYTCDLLYYARAHGDLHALREVMPTCRRDAIRGRWRETSLAGYAADMMRDLTPSGSEAREWYMFLSRFLDDLAKEDGTLHQTCRRMLIRLEMGLLKLSGLAPDFSNMDPGAAWTEFSIDRGCCGSGVRTVRLTPTVVAALRGVPGAGEEEAVRFLGIFLAYHLERPIDVRRSLVSLISFKSTETTSSHT